MSALWVAREDPTVEGDVRRTDDPEKKHKMFPLSVAAREGHVEIMKLLLAQDRVNVNQVSTDQGRSAFFVGCSQGNYKAVSEIRRKPPYRESARGH